MSVGDVRRPHFIEVSGIMPGMLVSSNSSPCSEIICPQTKAPTSLTTHRRAVSDTPRAHPHPARAWGNSGLPPQSLEAAALPGAPRPSWWTAGCLSGSSPGLFEGCQIHVTSPPSSFGTLISKQHKPDTVGQLLGLAQGEGKDQDAHSPTRRSRSRSLVAWITHKPSSLFQCREMVPSQWRGSWRPGTNVASPITRPHPHPGGFKLAVRDVVSEQRSWPSGYTQPRRKLKSTG